MEVLQRQRWSNRSTIRQMRRFSGHRRCKRAPKLHSETFCTSGRRSLAKSLQPSEVFGFLRIQLITCGFRAGHDGLTVTQSLWIMVRSSRERCVVVSLDRWSHSWLRSPSCWASATCHSSFRSAESIWHFAIPWDRCSINASENPQR